MQDKFVRVDTHAGSRMTKFFCNQTRYGCDLCCDIDDHVKRTKAEAEEIKYVFPCLYSRSQTPHWLVVGGKYESG